MESCTSIYYQDLQTTDNYACQFQDIFYRFYNQPKIVRSDSLNKDIIEIKMPEM